MTKRFTENKKAEKNHTFHFSLFTFHLVILLFSFFTLHSSFISAQPSVFEKGIEPVVIEGSADAYKTQIIGAYTYKDLITYTPFMVGLCKINDSGHFSIQLPNIKTSQYLYLNIENQKGSIYVSPGNTYHIIFPAPDSLHYQNPYISHSVDLKFLSNDPDNINNIIIDFNQQFELFWRKYYTYFVRKQANAVLDSFHITMRQRYADVKNPYFWGYLDYTIAGIGISIMEGEKTLGNKYLKGKPVLYHNYEYMKFFNDYFNDYLEQLAIKRSRQTDDVNRYIKAEDYADLMEALKINPLLRANDSLCELVLLKGLYELYYSSDYNQNNIIKLLQNIASFSKIEEDKTIAQDMLNSFSDVVSGAPAPEFTMKDAQGDVSNLLDFRGKYLYLCFFKSNSEACLAELDVVTTLRKQYGRKINFVCISEDDNYADLHHFLDQNKMFNWVFLYDEGHKALKQYDVKALPEFFLIDRKGNFYKSPADSPSHGIQLIFDKIFSHKTK